MDEKLIKNLLDILPQYINFSIAFLRSPRKAFGPYAMKGQVHSDITSFLFAGVGAAYLFVLVLPFEGFNTQNPQGGVDMFAHWLTDQEPKLLPLHCLMAILALVLSCHLSAKLFCKSESLLARWSESKIQPDFPGAAEDSVNAALGFAAVMLPLNVACYGMALLWADSSAVTKFSAFAPFFVVLGTFILLGCVTLFYYFIMSFASVHGVSWWRAASALCGAGVVFIALVYIVN
jgi:hypothetical protein